jgi:hypothetical protein
MSSASDPKGESALQLLRAHVAKSAPDSLTFHGSALKCSNSNDVFTLVDKACNKMATLWAHCTHVRMYVLEADQEGKNNARSLRIKIKLSFEL